MHKEISNFILYRDKKGDSILSALGKIFEDFEAEQDTKEHLRTRIYEQVHRLLEVATKYGFDCNLWHNYLTFVLMTHENPFSLTYEKTGSQEGTVNHFAIHDFDVFKRLFDFDFSSIENALGIDCFSVLCHYTAISKREQIYNKSVSEKVHSLSKKIEAAKDGHAVLDVISKFYRQYGV